MKTEAKAAKAFMVLLKRKLQREQVCRNPEFRALMAMVFKDHDSLVFQNEVGREVGSIWELSVLTFIVSTHEAPSSFIRVHLKYMFVAGMT